MKALYAGRIRPSKTKADSLLIFRYSFDLFFVGTPTAKLQSLAVTELTLESFNVQNACSGLVRLERISTECDSGQADGFS
jgi:hypothetical protein